MPTTIEIGIVVTLAVVVIEAGIQGYRRYKDNTSEEITELTKTINDLNTRLDKVEETQRQTMQYLLGYQKRDGDKGVLGDVQSSLDSLQGEMESEHEKMYEEIKQNNLVLAELVDQLHDLEDVDDFEKGKIKGDQDQWRAD